MSSRARFISGVALLLALAACGDDSVGPPERVVKAQPSFATDIIEIFQRRGCSASDCHGAMGGRAGLELVGTAAADYAQLVNVGAALEAFDRVVPGNADDSYLVIKVEGRQGIGQRMPIDGAPLDDIDLTNIRNWVENGAPNN
jgi:hypothetical protein